MIYGYCRISTKKQNIQRQLRNILTKYMNAKIYQEIYTGTTNERPQWQKLLKILKKKDTIIFDSVSRMSRNSVIGIKIYFELMKKGVSLIFLKELHINTEIYLKALNKGLNIVTENKILKPILNGIELALKEVAKQQIIICFEQSEKEVQDLRQRTKEGLLTAKINGKILGRKFNSCVITKKSIEMKKKILLLNKAFKGNLNNKQTYIILKINKTTFYKYLKALKKLKEY